MSVYEHPEWEALLKAITRAIDDNLPRLIAADWLDDHEEPLRAEFIRLQIELTSEGLTEARYEWLRHRIQTLWQNPAGGPLWAVEACPGFVRYVFDDQGRYQSSISLFDIERVRFQRGFLQGLTCSAEAWFRHGGNVIPRQPLETLSLTQCDDVSIDRWWPHLGMLRQLRRVTVDSRWNRLPRILREQLPDVEILPVR